MQRFSHKALDLSVPFKMQETINLDNTTNNDQREYLLDLFVDKTNQKN
jgi:hypothetical protein